MRFVSHRRQTSATDSIDSYRSEKGFVRVKLHDSEGRLLAVLATAPGEAAVAGAPDVLSAKAAGLDLAVDPGGRIYVADPVAGKVHVFVQRTEERK